MDTCNLNTNISYFHGSLLQTRLFTLYICPCQVTYLENKITDTPIKLNARLNPHDGEPFLDHTLYHHLFGNLLVYLTVVTCLISHTLFIK
jgi:hypothetical protein